MRQRTLTGGRAVLLAGPFVLAFFAGGYFDGPRAWAGLVASALVLVAALLARHPLPRAAPPRLAMAALALLGFWSLASVTWAPVAGPAYHEGERVLLYAAALVAATALLRGGALRAVEPALAAGVLVVIGYGLSERLVPSVVTLYHSVSALGRLDQPLTYWNATGMLAALGLVLCARLAGDRTRGDRLRMAAAGAAAPLGLGLYVTFSRGALFACAAGLVALFVAVPTRPARRGIALALTAAVAASAWAAPWKGVTRLAGSHGHRVLGGAVTLAGVLALVLLAAARQAWVCRREADGRLSIAPLRMPRHAAALALLVVICAFGAFLAAGAHEHGGVREVGAARLTTLESNRYEYWKVAVHAFADEPIRGLGSGGWSVRWLRDRPFSEGARDAHSLYLQTAAELGLVGLALLGAFGAGLALAARRAHGFSPERAAGPIAGVVVLASHLAVDWDWEIPAATLPAILLAGALLALSDLAPRRS